MSSAQSVLDALAELGVPVVGPGGVLGALPAVHVTPTDDRLDGDGRYLVHVFTVSPTVPRDAAAERLVELELLTEQTVIALLDAGLFVQSRIAYQSGDAEEVPYLSRRVTVEAPPRVIC